jgi:beta-1,4-mannosyltransferase
MPARSRNGNMVNGAAVAVVVMGDIARSPRMLNHARELAANGFAPVLIGYREREFEPPAGVRVAALDGGRSAPRERSALLFAITAGSRMSQLFFALLGTLLREKPEVILVQNPPSFPTLLAAALAGKWLRAKVIVDWHNYGFSLLALRLGDRHWLVRLARWYEFRAGRGAGAHLCVSDAMRADLLRYGIVAKVLYDRPLALRAHNSDTARIVAICPAGWTADEDIELLLAALHLLRDSSLTVYITGEGMKRKELEPELQVLRASGVLVDTGFLPEDDYWSLISRADLGLSLHRSSSGLDLAMKVVDLFSASMPVCALDYGGSIPEQIEEGVTGFLFHTAQDLAQLLQRLAAAPETLASMRLAIGDRWTASWHEEWKRIAMPALGAKS